MFVYCIFISRESDIYIYNIYICIYIYIYRERERERERERVIWLSNKDDHFVQDIIFLAFSNIL